MLKTYEHQTEAFSIIQCENILKESWKGDWCFYYGIRHYSIFPNPNWQCGVSPPLGSLDLVHTLSLFLRWWVQRRGVNALPSVLSWITAVLAPSYRSSEFPVCVFSPARLQFLTKVHTLMRQCQKNWVTKCNQKRGACFSSPSSCQISSNTQGLLNLRDCVMAVLFVPLSFGSFFG